MKILEGFKTVAPLSGGHAARASARITKCRSISISSALLVSQGIETKDRYCELYFNDTKSELALRFLSDKEAGKAVSLHGIRRNSEKYLRSGINVSVMGFFKAFGFDLKDGLVGFKEWHPKERVMIFDVSSVITSQRRNVAALPRAVRDVQEAVL